MYTNIDTNKALALICPFLQENERHFGHYDATTLIRAIEIVMHNNIVKFGDNYATQNKSKALPWGNPLLQPRPIPSKESKKLNTSQPGNLPSHSTSDTSTTST